ncbi:hypothetical protein N8639_01210 [bacterium]|nr:hypothetical protein [bacterium]
MSNFVINRAIPIPRKYRWKSKFHFSFVVSFVLCIVVGATLPPSVLLAQQKAVPLTQGELARQIDSLIDDLQSPKFSVRQAAANGLWRIGKSTEAKLQQALKSSNSEVVARAATILKDFEYGIYPNSDPSTIARIRKFRDGTENEKVRIARLLIKANQVDSLVKLIKKEPNFQTRQKISEVFVNRDFLRSYLKQNQTTEALNAISEIALNFKELQISSYYFDDIVADYLWLTLTTDSLSSELQKLKELNSGQADPYQRLVLIRAHRANDDFESAMSVVEKLDGETRQIAEINLLAEQHRWSALSDVTWKEEQVPITELNLEKRCEAINFHRLAGNEKRFSAELSRLKEFADALVDDLALPEGTPWTDNVNNRAVMQIVEFLFTCGELETACEYLSKTDRLKAFEAFNSIARLDKAFAVLGMKDLSDATFVKFNKRIRQYRPKGWDDPTADVSSFCDFAGFLYQMGFYEQAKEVYRSTVFAFSQFETESASSLQAICQGLMNNDQTDLFYQLIAPLVTDQNFPTVVESLLNDLPKTFDGTSLASYWWLVLAEQSTDSKVVRMQKLRQFLRPRLPDELIENEFDQLLTTVTNRSDLAAIDYAHLGQTYLLLNQRDRAKESFRKCIAIQDFDFGVGVALGDLHREDREFEPAYACYLAAWKSTEEITRLRIGESLPSPLPLYLAGLTGQELAKSQPHYSAASNEHLEKAKQLLLYGDLNREVRSGLIDRGFKEVGVEICRMVMKTGGFQDWELGNARSTLLDELKPEQGLLAANYLEGQLHDVAGTLRAYSSMASYTFFPNQVQLYRFDQFLNENKIDDAFAALQIALKFRPHSATIAEEYLPRLRNADGGKELADRLFEQIRAGHLKVLKKYPNSGLYNNNYAWVCTTNKLYLDEALVTAELVCKNEPNNSTYLDTLADVCFNLGQVDRAIKLMEKCLRMDPTSEHYIEQLAKFKTGQAPKTINR